MEIIDTHLHIWDLDKFSLPWLDDEGEILNRTYLLEDYKKVFRRKITRYQKQYTLKLIRRKIKRIKKMNTS